MQNLIFGPGLFYDIPEYLQIVTTHGFFQSIALGHFPIHPIFIAILWPLVKFLPVNLIAIVFSLISVLILSRISKKAALIYLMFPAIWIISTNLMVESILLTFYILAAYMLLKENKFWFFICIFLMVGIHLQAIYWVPTLFFIPIFLKKKFKFKKFVLPAVLGIIASVIFYLTIYKITGYGFGGSTEQMTTYFSSGIARMFRNSWLVMSTGFGSLTLFLLVFLIAKKAEKKEKIAALIFMVIFFFMAANWQGDFMVRRVAFAGVIFSILITRYLGKFWFLFAIYLLPIIFANILLYSKGNPFILPEIPPNQVLVETHYLKPFTKYNGTILYIEGNNSSIVDNYLDSGKRVFLTPAAVTAPYRLLTGNNYHITSLARIGNSESRFLFEKYDISKFENVYEIKKHEGKISQLAGEPVIFYGNSFWSRLARRRVNYGDVGIWAWSLITKHKDPSGWTYKDASGAWVYNEIGI